MTDKDQKMLESALWHISNSVTNGHSQAAECEITQWLKNKINSLSTVEEQPSEDLEDAARNIRDNLYLKEGKRDEYGNPYFLQDTLLEAVIAGANWQKEHMMKGLCLETKVYRDEEGDGIDTPIESWLALENNEIMNLPDIGLKDGDKVKVLIIKEDEQ